MADNSEVRLAIEADLMAAMVSTAGPGSYGDDKLECDDNLCRIG